MSEIDDENAELEDLLRQTAVMQPSGRLDERMSNLLRPRPRRVLLPILSFLAGSAATAAAMLVVLHPATPEVKPAAALPAAQPVPTLYTLPHVTVDEVDARINDVPVRLERTQHDYQVTRVSGPAGGWLKDAMLAGPVTYRVISHY